MSSGDRKGPVSWGTLAATAAVGGVAALAYQYAWQRKEAGDASVQKVESFGTPKLGGPFSLVDQDGKPVTDADFRGEYMLVYFGFTYCPDICPSELVKMDRIVSTVDKSVGPVVRPIFISVDPRRDSVSQLKYYARDFHPRMACLTGTPGQVAQAAKAYRVYFNNADQDDEEDMDYLVDHSIVIYLMDKEGKFLDFFTQTMEAEEVVRKVLKHIKEGDGK